MSSRRLPPNRSSPPIFRMSAFLIAKAAPVIPTSTPSRVRNAQLKSVSQFWRNVKNRVQKSRPPMLIWPQVVTPTRSSLSGRTIFRMKSGLILVSLSPKSTIS
jgi:hypothetical protein